MNVSLKEVPFRVWRKPRGKSGYLAHTSEGNRLMKLVGSAIRAGKEVECVIRRPHEAFSIINGRPYEVMDLTIKE